MKLFIKKIHHYYYIITITSFFFLLYPFLYYYSRKPERYSILNKFRHLWGFLSSSFSGILYGYEVQSEIDWKKNYIFCPNHTSNLDITALSIFIRSNFAFIGKDELLDNPVTGLFFKTIDIPLNRSSRMSAFRAFKKGGEYLEKGMSLVIFPEGKIPDEYPPVLDSFKNGPFRLALEHKIAIVPVTIRDTWQKMWDDGSVYGSKPGICHICIHKPIATSALTFDDLDSLRDKVYEIINTELKKHEAR